MAVVDQMLRRWRAGNAAMRPGASEDAIEAFERRHSAPLPKDFRRYLQLANGAEPADDLFAFWPIEDIRPVEIELAGVHPDQDLFPGCFVFCDWGIHAWLYAIQLQGSAERRGNVFVVEVNGTRRPPIAASFSDWVTKYLRDARELSPSS